MQRFWKGLVWGGALTSIGILLFLAQDDMRRQRMIERGERLKQFLSSLGMEMMAEGKETWGEMELQKELPLLRQEMVSRLNELEKRIKQLGEKMKN